MLRDRESNKCIGFATMAILAIKLDPETLAPRTRIGALRRVDYGDVRFFAAHNCLKSFYPILPALENCDTALMDIRSLAYRTVKLGIFGEGIEPEVA